MGDSGFYTYILACADGSFYAGWTTDPHKRLDAHNRGAGARYTRTRLPVRLLHAWAFASKREAMQYEHWLKSLSRPQKEQVLRDLGVWG